MMHGEIEQNQKKHEKAFEYDKKLSAILTCDIPENSYIHLKDKFGVYYVFRVAVKTGNFLFVECEFGPKAARYKRGLILDKFLARNHKVHFGIEELPENAFSMGNAIKKRKDIDPLNEIIISNNSNPILPNVPITFGESIPSFDTELLPPENVEIVITTRSGSKYTIDILTVDERGNIIVAIRGKGSLSSLVGRLQSRVIGKNYRILIKDSMTRKNATTSRVTDLKLQPVIKGSVEAVLVMKHRKGQIGPFNQ